MKRKKLRILWVVGEKGTESGVLEFHPALQVKLHIDTRAFVGTAAVVHPPGRLVVRVWRA